jgi:hypothetical protein
MDRVHGLAAAFLAVLSMADATAGGADFRLRPEWNGPCARAESIDVNLGNAPEAFVRAAHCQVTGQEPPKELVAAWSKRLREDPKLRRVDVVRTLCQDHGRAGAPLAYSDPWLNDPDLPPPTGPKRVKRDVGAVVMFFFHCPGGQNCHMDWANTHAPGMQSPSPGLAWNGSSGGYYDASNPGFWRRELRDAKAAGLQFILPNVYGPDMDQDGRIRTLAQALAAEDDPVKVAYFDDTWAWGRKWFGPFWEEKPDFHDPEAAAEKLYQAKWKPYFSTLDPRFWYRVQGRPLIYFYNAGTLAPRERSAEVFRRMKAMFRRDFGVEPFLAMDRAFFDDPEQPRVADARFIWDPLKHGDANIFGLGRSALKGVTLAHAMVRWDSIGRDRPGALASDSDLLLKGPELLEHVLKQTEDVDLLVIATWNDLGEGTGINRNYDYYYRGAWQRPDAFMDLIRQAQFGDSLTGK